MQFESGMSEDPIETSKSRFFSILQLNAPISPLNVSELQADKEHWEDGGAVALMMSIYLEEMCRKFLVCLAENINKPLRPIGLEASQIEELADERDRLARAHYDMRKRNVHSSTILNAFQEFFQKAHEKQTNAASEIIQFIEKLREDHRIKKEAMNEQKESLKSQLENQQEYNLKLSEELKALTRKTADLEREYNEKDLLLLEQKIQFAVRGTPNDL